MYRKGTLTCCELVLGDEGKEMHLVDDRSRITVEREQVVFAVGKH